MIYNMKKPEILLDIMLDGRFVCQLRYARHGQFKIINGRMQEIHDLDDIQAFVEKERPHLIGQPYKIEFSQQHI